MRVLPRQSELVMMAGILLLGYIWANALWWQPARHPAPLFQPDTTQTAPYAPPVPALRNGNAAAPVSPTPAGGQAQPIRELQTNLRSLGYYNGDVDGLDGPMTHAAISGYEAANDLPATGKASPGLLAHVKQSVRDAARNTPGAAPAPQVRPTPRAQPVTQDQPAPADEFQLILSVQRALADLGYAPGPINGAMGQQTVDAIRDFQADRGMPITGKMGVTLVLELEAVSGVPLNR